MNTGCAPVPHCEYVAQYVVSISRRTELWCTVEFLEIRTTLIHRNYAWVRFYTHAINFPVANSTVAEWRPRGKSWSRSMNATHNWMAVSFRLRKKPPTCQLKTIHCNKLRSYSISIIHIIIIRLHRNVSEDRYYYFDMVTMDSVKGQPVLYILNIKMVNQIHAFFRCFRNSGAAVHWYLNPVYPQF